MKNNLVDILNSTFNLNIPLNVDIISYIYSTMDSASILDLIENIKDMSIIDELLDLYITNSEPLFIPKINNTSKVDTLINIYIAKKYFDEHIKPQLFMLMIIHLKHSYIYKYEYYQEFLEYIQNCFIEYNKTLNGGDILNKSIQNDTILQNDDINNDLSVLLTYTINYYNNNNDELQQIIKWADESTINNIQYYY